MSHRASPAFWKWYQQLSPEIQALADEAFERLQSDPRHPSLHFKRTGEHWSVRIGKDHRALGVDTPTGILWLWIGGHEEYERRIR